MEKVRSMQIECKKDSVIIQIFLLILHSVYMIY